MKKIGILVLFGLLISMGAAYGGIFGDIMKIGAPKYSVVRAPEVVLKDVKSIGVEGFRGKGGETFASALVTGIKEPNKAGPEPKGEAMEGLASGLVEGVAAQATGGMSQLVTESVSSIADLGSAPVYEKGLTTMPFTTVKRGSDGVDAVISGTMETQGPSDSNFEAKKITYNANGEKQEKTVSCTKREAKLTVRMNIKTSDGNVLASRDASTASSASRCQGDSQSLPSGDAMFDEMARQLAPGMALSFCPYYNSFKIKLQKDKKTKASVKAVTKEKNWDTAVAVWENIVQADPYQYASLYNLGVAHEVHGNYDKAVDCFTKAEAASAHKRNQKAIARVNARKAEVERLQGYGMAIVPCEFKAVAPTTMVISIKGKASKRLSIYQDASETSPKIIDLPGAMVVDLVTIQGEWYKIKTKDGKFEGWILKKNLKIKE